jgi:hypothetical protein
VAGAAVGAAAAVVAVAGGRVAVGAEVGAVVAALVAAGDAGAEVRGGVKVEVGPSTICANAGVANAVAARVGTDPEVGCAGTGNGVPRAGAAVAAAAGAEVGAVPLNDGALAQPINATSASMETMTNKRLRNIVDSTGKILLLVSNFCNSRDFKSLKPRDPTCDFIYAMIQSRAFVVVALAIQQTLQIKETWDGLYPDVKYRDARGA